MKIADDPSSPSTQESGGALSRLTYLWTIENFRQRCEENKVLRSGTFSGGNTSGPIWVLRLYLKSIKKESSDHLSVYLFLDSSNEKKVHVIFQFSILNANKEKAYAKPRSPRAVAITEKGSGYQRFISRDFVLDESNGLLIDDKLIICCDLTIYVPIQIPACCLSEDMERLLETGMFTDLILKADGGTFAVHRGILSARSPVFSAMFENDMVAKRQEAVDMTDINFEVLREMLNYIYTGKVSNLDNRTEELLKAADKYGLNRLKLMCEESLCVNLSVENAADVYLIADMYSSEQLKTRVIDFINFYSIGAMNTIGWQAMKQDHPLIPDIFRDLATQLTQNSNSTEFFFSFRFAIDSFRCKFLTEKAIRASTSAGRKRKLNCFFEFYPKGRYDEESKDFATLSVLISFPSGFKIPENRVALKVSILNTAEKKTNVKKATGISVNFSKFVPRNILLNVSSGLISGDTLVLCCDVCVSVPIHVPKCHLLKDFAQFFECGNFSDVILSAKGRDLAAHKGILAARSPLLFTTLQLGTRSKVIIPDIDVNVLRDMLRFIYTGTLTDFADRQQGLLVAAEKYGLCRLKAICEEQVCMNLCVENAAELLVFAFRHKAQQLKPRVIDFIRFYAADVEVTEGWQKVIQIQPHLTGVFRSLVD